MNKSIAECVDYARYCAWNASKTKNEAEQKFLIHLAERWTELAAEKEREFTRCYKVGCVASLPELPRQIELTPSTQLA